MMKIKNKKYSIRFQLFTILCVSTISTIVLLIIANSFFSENIFKYFKIQKSKKVCEDINYFFNNENNNLKRELEQIEDKDGIEILIVGSDDEVIYNNYKGIKYSVDKANERNNGKKLFENEKFNIKLYNISSITNFILVKYDADNGYIIYIKIPTLQISETIKIVNICLIIIGFVLILIFGLIAIWISKKFTIPIIKLIEITDKMKNLEFEKKYRITGYNGDFNNLGKNVNEISEKFETTLRQLRQNNNELEKDIIEKSKIDEIRKEFISDISHELKTPISLIEGYAEGLLENVNEDEESRKIYCEVIIDEANKMDKMVGELLELTKFEYEEKKLNDTEVDLNEVIEKEIKRETVLLKNKNIDVEYERIKELKVLIDQECIEKIVTNFFTNAIKHCQEIDGEKKIVIRTEKRDNNKIRLYIYNTGKKIPEEYKNKIWGRFFKIDSSRNRKDGGTGIGLALIKAIMKNYNNEYGFSNYENGVEFYCDINRV